MWVVRGISTPYFTCFAKWALFFFRFELKYFDPFLVLDEFSGGLMLISTISPIFLCFCLFDEWKKKHGYILLALLKITFFFFTVSAPGGFPDHPHRGLYSNFSAQEYNY